MADSFDIALNKANKNFYKVIEKMKADENTTWDSCEFYPCENEEHETLKMLDSVCGIDFFAKHTSGNVIGIACRIQQGNYKTFTVRKERISGAKTEFEKRSKQVGQDLICPKLHIQAYMDNLNDGNVLSVGIAEEKDILSFIKCGFAEERITGFNQIGQAKFYVCDWDEMNKRNFKVQIIE